MNEAPSDLPSVLKEITSALLDGDWTRYEDDAGEHFYYVIRERDHGVEIKNLRAFDNMLIFEKSEPDGFEDWYIRAALAEEPPDRLAKARKRVEAAGIDPRFFDAVIEASRSANSQEEIGKVLDEWMHRFVDDRLHALNAMLEGLRIDRVKRKQIFVSESDRPELRRALEARLLKELAERYPKVVKRASSFDWLSFSDPQVREASRCYLYGFFRAAVLVAAAALEARLKKVGAVEALKTYDALVDCVFGVAGVCGRDDTRAAALKDLFDLRNRIAHEGVEPKAEEATDALDLVRETFEMLAKRFDEIA